MLNDAVGDVLQLRNVVVDHIRLPVSTHLKLDGIVHRVVVKGGNLRAHRITIGRRSTHDAHISCTHERELQGARDGRGRHCKRIDVRFEGAQFLFGRYAELLFLVDNKQAEVFPHHIFADQLMCSHEDVYLSGCEVFEDAFHLRSSAGAG